MTDVFSYIVIVLFVFLKTFSDSDLNVISYSVSISVFLCLLYDKWLWRYNPFVSIPKIYGKYKCTFKSTHNTNIVFHSDIVIKQTLSKIVITEKMTDGICISLTYSLYRYSEEDNQWFILYTYLTHPKKDGDDMHYGTSILYIVDDNTLEGFYYTNRVMQTKGQQTLKKVDNRNVM